LVGAGDRSRGGHQPARAAGGEGGREVLDAAALRPDSGQQEGRARHQLPSALKVLGRRRADHRAHVAELPPVAEVVDQRRDALPRRHAALGQRQVLEVARARVRRAYHHEQPARRLARSAGEPWAGATSTASGHSRAGSGSSPRTTWDSRSPTSAARRVPKAALTGRWGGGLRTGLTALEGLFQAGAGGELGHARGRDLDLLAGARVHALAGAALSDAELAEAREVHLAAPLERVLDGLQKGIDSLGGIGL